MNFMNEQQQQQTSFNPSDMFIMEDNFLQENTFYQDEKLQEFDGDNDKKGNFKTSFYNPFEVKHRRRTSRAQFKVLEKMFLENPKPNAAVRRWLAQKLVMTPRGVQVWFQNRRAKEKSKKPSTVPQQVSIMSSPVNSVCACSDCSIFPTPMSRTYSNTLDFDEEATTPITPSDSQSFSQAFMFPMYMNNNTKTNWNLPPFYKPNMYNNMTFTQPMIDSNEFFNRLSEPIFDPSMTSFDGFDLLPRNNSF